MRCILLTYFRLPALITFSVDINGNMEHHQTIVTGRNILDVTVSQEDQLIIYTLDNVHIPLSTKEIGAETGDFLGAHRFSLESNSWVDERSQSLWSRVKSWARSEQHPPGQSNNHQQLSDVLYGWGNLRKRGDEEYEPL